MHLLVIEDNADIVANVHGFLEPLGHEVESARSGSAGLALLMERSYDAVVLDVMLPGMDGLEVCRRLRNTLALSVPVLMLTARDTVPDKVVGLASGADDYMVKPFSLVELEARLAALLRRGRTQGRRAVLQLGDLEFDTGTYEVRRAGQVLRLTPTGYRLLAALLRAAPEVVPRHELERAVWGEDRPDSDALRTHIHALRAAVDKPFGTSMLRTVQGIGFRLVADDGA